MRSRAGSTKRFCSTIAATSPKAAVENIFLVFDGVVTTNDASSDILEGITRASVLDIARELGIPTAVRDLTRADLANCDEAFFTGTAAEIVPIVRIDGRIMPDGRPVTDRLRTTYSDVVRGKRPFPGDWLTPLE